VKGGDVLENAAKVQAVLFDKTGTLTLSSPRVVRMVPIAGVEPDEVLSVAASAEMYSEHALGKAIVREARRRALTVREPDEFDVLPGMGVLSKVADAEVLVGNEELLRHVGIDAATLAALPDGIADGTTKVFVARNGQFVGTLYFEDTPRKGIKETVQGLRRQGIERFALITGDEVEASRQVAALAGIAEVQGSLLPEDKVRVVETLRRQGLTVLMVGDGVNDAPALAAANVAVAVGDTATDASLEVADVALLEADLEKVAWFVTHARRTRRIILQNILFGLALNFAGILLAFLGWISPLGAAALHEGNALVVVLNSARLALGR
ncbi:MAG: HAD-IC family P-type ATPase, partial [Thermoplasmata archaeon]